MANDRERDDSDLRETADLGMKRFRERVAALIALLIILSSISMVALAFRSIGDKERFDRSKDLLLLINPILGVVIGYYFNKVSMEARAESAENTARTASETARVASESQEKAEKLADAARGDAEQAQAHLQDLSVAAEKMLAQAPARAAATLSAEGNPEVADARAQLEAAVTRAKRVWMAAGRSAAGRSDVRPG